ncbi:MAG: hypothetical protein AAF628_15720 [Planctomycetota bacterium]
MTETAAATPRPNRVAIALGTAIDAVMLGAAAFGLYLWLGQETVYSDGYTFLLGTQNRRYSHPFHPGYMPLARQLLQTLRPHGFGQYEIFRLLSQLGVALGVVLTAVGLRVVGLDRARVRLATAWVAVTPAVVFFATVVEVHGAFFAAASLAWLAAACLWRRPSITAAVALGLLTAGATLMHASGVLLPLPLLLLFVAAPPHRLDVSPLKRRLRLAAVALLVHGVGYGLSVWTTRSLGARVEPGTAAGFVAGLAEHVRSAQHFAEVAWSEWLWPFATASLTWWLCFCRRGQRRLGLGLLGALAVYLPAAALVLSLGPERGAYLLPLAVPAAALGVAALPRRVAQAAVLISLALAVAGVWSHDERDAARAFRRGVHAAVAPYKPFVLVGDPAEVEACLVANLEFIVVLDSSFLLGGQNEKIRRGFDRHLRNRIADGYRVLLTESADAQMRDEEVLAAFPPAATWTTHLRATYDFDRVPGRHRAFQGWRLTPR